MICFIILHYEAIEETINCISSIKSMDMQDRIKVVIVDNASPNGSGAILSNLYQHDQQVMVICNSSNYGFSKGNNLGCQIALKKWKPEFYVFTNNDIVFKQKEFPEILYQESKKSHFTVLGPDIFNERMQIHQNPLAFNPPNSKTVTKTIFFNTIALWTFEITYPLIKLYYDILEKRNKNAKKFDCYQENICLMGACLIFSKEFIETIGYAFCPETLFYYEEFLLALNCKENKYKMVYQPSLQVIHMEGVSTKLISNKERERIKFRIYNILNSAKIYKIELKKYLV